MERQKAIAYIRTSTEDQALSVKAQLDTIVQYCAHNDIVIDSICEAEGISGGAPIEERETLMRAVDLVGTQRADFLLVAKRDRLARDIVVSAMVERLVASNGGKVVSCDGVTSDDTPEGLLLRRMIDVFAEYERMMIKARTRAALRQKKQRGEKLGGRIPFGWKVKNGALIEDEYEQDIVKHIKCLKENHLMTYDDIVKRLSEQSFRNRGKLFTRSTVVRICKQDYKSIGG